MFDKELADAVDAEVGNGDFGKALVYLCYPPDKLDAHIVDYCLQGIGARERVLYPVLCARSNEEMTLLKQAFFDVKEKDIAVVLNEELKGEFEKFIFFCLQGREETYDPDYHTEEKAIEDAEAFFQAGQGQWFGTDEKSFFELLSKSPTEHLQKVNEIYSEKHGISIVDALDKEMGGGRSFTHF
jgi:annexin A13